MFQRLEDARKLAHGTYDDVIIVEHRRPTVASAAGGSADELRGGLPAVHVVLEMPEGSRAIDTAQQYEIDGVLGDIAPTVGGSYRLIVAPSTAPQSATEATPTTALRYETMNR